MKAARYDSLSSSFYLSFASGGFLMVQGLRRSLHLTLFVVLLFTGLPVLGQGDEPVQNRFFTLPCHPLMTATDEDYGAGRSDPFLRELARQSILLSAREHFGLITRDPLLGERLPKGVSATPLDYHLDLERQQPVQVSILGLKGRTFGPFTLNGPAGKIEGYHPLAQEAERFSREEAIEALQQSGLGYQLKPTKEAASTPLAKTYSDRLYNMDLITQFYLARELHALIRREGQNAQRLAALSQVYSNLGQLTRYRTDYSCQALHARAMLYGYRATQLYPDRPEGYWAVDFAWIMFDLPGEWGDGEGDQVNAALAKADQAEPPTWLAIKSLYDRYDSIGLMKFSQKPGPLAELAAILAVAASETQQLNALHRAVLENCQAINPDTQRGYDVCFHSWWLKSDDYATERYLSFYEAIPRVLEEHAEQVPDDALQLSRNLDTVTFSERGAQFLNIAEIAWAFDDSDDNELEQEFSDAALGHLLVEMLAAAAIDLYAEPSQRSSGRQPRASTWNQIIPAFQRHRYAKLFELFRYSVLGSVRERNAISEQIELGDINFLLAYRMYSALPPERRFANMQGGDTWAHLHRQFTQNVTGIFTLARMYGSSFDFRVFASWVYGGSLSNVPFRLITRIRHHEVNEEEMLAWLEQGKHMPGMLMAAAEWYEANGKFAEAYDLLWQLIDLVPDKELIADAAEFALKIGEIDTWRELMVDVRDADRNIPPYGNVDLIIGATYMEGQEWDEALHWVSQAHQKQKWGNQVNVYLAWCLHHTGETKEAIKLLQNYDNDYGTDFAPSFCYQLGLEETDDVVAQYEQRTLPTAARNDPRRRIANEIFQMTRKGQSEEAIPLLKKAWEDFDATNDGVRLAIFGQQFGDDALRDQTLKELANDRAGDHRSAVIAAFARTVLDTPETLPTDNEIAGIVRQHHRWTTRAYARLNFGWYLLASGEVERGQKWLLEILADKRIPIGSVYDRYMAIILLRESGYDMDNHRWQFPDAQDWPEE